MSVTFQLPDDLEHQLRRELSNLDELAKEAALAELYRQEKLTHHQLATALGLDRFETEDLLTRHNVTEDLITAAQFNAQLATLRKLVGG
jgi:Uncharacterised protein family (UPF0175)